MNFTFANVVVAAAVGSHWYGCGEGSIWHHSDGW